MADVRSLLRQERAARQHAKPPRQSAAPAAAPTSKKRKAADDGSEERKRTRTEETIGVPAAFFDREPASDEHPSPPAAPVPMHDDEAPGPTNPAHIQPPLGAAADAELDAFMAEMNQPAEPQRSAPSYAGAVIEAAPMTAAELAAQARDEQNAQRAKRDEEMEGEKEDAARALEDEFDEMEGLEERVRRLREQREALRTKHLDARSDAMSLPTPQPEEEESESEDEDWDDWRFRPA